MNNVLKSFFIVVFAMALFTNCRKNKYEPIVTDIGHQYFPIKLGQSFIYKADSFRIGYQGTPLGGEKKVFYIKEDVIYKFGDSIKTVYTFARYHSYDSLKWNFVKYHFYEIEKYKVLHKEDNILTTELVFPVSLKYYWNGNEFNNLDYQEFEYSILGFDFNLFDKKYTKSIKVRMDSTVNSVQNHIKTNVYSSGIGIIYHESTNIDVPANDTIGVRFTKSLLKFTE
ncbi:MAG: hypothetical protein IT243_03095 [Bacteroidia bacterium]|nr:hypothetical protein [Bacteroidia bacterium]